MPHNFILLATCLLAASVAVKANNYEMNVKVLGCNGQPVESAVVTLTGCTSNKGTTAIVRNTDGSGIAAFTVDNKDADAKSLDVVQYCFSSAAQQCKFVVSGVSGTTYDMFVLPTPPKTAVKNTCDCSVCDQFQGMTYPECPETVQHPGCGTEPETIVISPKAGTCCNSGGEMFVCESFPAGTAANNAVTLNCGASCKPQIEYALYGRAGMAGSAPTDCTCQNAGYCGFLGCTTGICNLNSCPPIDVTGAIQNAVNTCQTTAPWACDSNPFGCGQGFCPTSGSVLLKVNNVVAGGDPCVGTYKYLKFKYSCVPDGVVP